ncbi:MAG: hypothetical protein IPN51_08000 [Chloracidobacterium sp.]|nr:hypothetical protein [Chloracidobacterium sp.]
MSVILGINTFHAGSSASVIIDGVPVVALAEERLNRVKYYAGFPTLSIKKCLEIAGVKFSDIDGVAVGRDSSANLRKKLEFSLRHPGKLLNLARMRSKSKTFDDMKSLIATECRVDSDTLKFQTYNVEHHLAHTASAYFISEWDKCAGITIDGSGDFVSCLLSDCSGDEIKPLKKIFVPHSLGTLYTAVCQFIGYGKYGDEGKVMGLAPLGSDVYHDFFEKMLISKKDGFELNPEYFLPFGANQGMEINDAGEMVVHRLYSDKFINELGAPREKRGEITQRDMDVSFSLQHVFEKYYMHLLNSLHNLVPTEKVSMAGGCALNSVANGKLLIDTPFRETCIQPAAGDDGLAIGAALYVSNSILKENKRWVMKDSYLGNEFSDSVIKAELERYNVSFKELSREELLEATAEEIKTVTSLAGSKAEWNGGRVPWATARSSPIPDFPT